MSLGNEQDAANGGPPDAEVFQFGEEFRPCRLSK